MRALHDQRGFTLVELLVAASVAAIGFLGLAATHVIALRATVTGRNTTIATALAGDQMETLRRVSYDEIVASSSSIMSGHQYYVRQTTVAPSPVGDSKQVTITTSWSDEFGAHNVRLVSVIAP